VYVSDVSLGTLSPDLVVIMRWALKTSLDIIVACNYLSDTCIVLTRAVESRLESCVVHLFGSCQKAGSFSVAVRENIVAEVLTLTEECAVDLGAGGS
jgi:hypothetical protein